MIVVSAARLMENIFGGPRCAERCQEYFPGRASNGKGQTWADGLTFEVVDRSIAVTNKGSAQGADDPAYAKIPKATIKRPINLGFEEGRVP